MKPNDLPPLGAFPVPAAEIVFLDPAVPGGALLAEAIGPGAEVVWLDADADALEAMAAHLGDRQDLAAVHIVSHGAAGALAFSGGTVTAADLPARAEALARIGAALGDDGDILLYGCSVGAGGEGRAFVEALAEATGADVAASHDLTGAAGLGGDWVLEESVGRVEAAPLDVAPEVRDALGVLATFTVTTTADSGAGSLRFAFQAANADSGTDTIVFDPSLAGQTITLGSTLGTVENPLVIDGDIDDDGTPDVTVEGDGTFRFLEAEETLELDGLVVRGFGATSAGGAILSYGPWADSKLTIRNSVFEDNQGTRGGAVRHGGRGDVEIVGTRFSDNTGNVTAGAVYIGEGAEPTDLITIDRSVFESNSTGTGSSASGAIEIKDFEGFGQISNSLFVSNEGRFQVGVFNT